MELTVIEDRRAQQLRKLSRIYDHGGNATGSATELFGSPSSASSPGTKFIHGEGESMAAGWKTIKDEIQLLLEVHQVCFRRWQLVCESCRLLCCCVVRKEFRSLLSEPVALSLETMKTEYESTGAAAQENFVKIHSSLCFESAAHLKLRQRFRGKLRDFSTALVSLQDGKVDEMTASVAEAMDSLKAVRELSGTFSERERRTEQKLRQLVGEMKQLEPVLNASLATLKDRYHLYVQVRTHCFYWERSRLIHSRVLTVRDIISCAGHRDLHLHLYEEREVPPTSGQELAAVVRQGPETHANWEFDARDPISRGV